MESHTTLSMIANPVEERRKGTRMQPLSTIAWEEVMRSASQLATIGEAVTTIIIENEGALIYAECIMIK